MGFDIGKRPYAAHIPLDKPRETRLQNMRYASLQNAILPLELLECLGVSKRQLRRWRTRLNGPLTTENHAFLRAFLSDLGAW
jgi:hypothetical protein